MNSTPNSLPCYLEASLGYIHGDLQDNDKCCTKCARGGGRFPFCVTLSNWVDRKKYFGGACINCRWTNHPEECSLNTTSNGDGKKLRGIVDMDPKDPPGPSDGSGASDDDDDDTMGEDEPVIERKTRGRARGKGQKPAVQEEEEEEDDDDPMDEDEPVIETKSRDRARGKGKKQVVQEGHDDDDDDGSDMDKDMVEAGNEDESDASDPEGKGKQSAIIEDTESETEVKPTQPAGRKSTRGVAKPKGKKPALSSQTPGVKDGTKAAKGKAKEGIKKNPDGSRNRE